MKQTVKINVKSEVGELEDVIIHTPGAEVENMTPQNAQRALYSDILNLDIAKWEHAQLSGVLKKVSKTHEVKDLLEKVLMNNKAKELLINTVCKSENLIHIQEDLLDIDPATLSRILLEGMPLNRNNLTEFLSEDRFSLAPLYNFYFTRDASVSINNDVLISRMANKVRERETLIMEAIFNYSGVFKTSTVNSTWYNHNPDVKIEGGDVLVAREDILIVGSGTRTTTQGIDFILSRILAQKDGKKRHILVQELPDAPESFIHLDMVFTLLDHNYCMMFEPVIMKLNKFQTVQITVEHGKVAEIKNVPNLIVALKT